jgi:tetratricopeptide (TPR) repeat protein
MEIDSELLKLLMEIGFLAGDKGRLPEAQTIFEGVSKARPQSAYPYIGTAYVAMNKSEFEKAIAILRDAPHQDAKEKEISGGFLGMALKFAGYNEEAQRVLSDIKENGIDEIAINMASVLLEKDLSAMIK